MNNQNDSKDDLDPKLQALYRQLPKEQPSKELDAKILAAAKITTPPLNQKKSRPWQAPFALAASVVMVSSVALYLHEENPAAFDASVPTSQAPAAEIAKPDVEKETIVNSITNSEPLTDEDDRKNTTQKLKDAAIAKPQEAPTTSVDDSKDNELATLTEKKADIASRADQMAETTRAYQSAKLAQSAIIAKEQEARQAKAENDQFVAATPVPAPMIAPPVQSQPEAAELRTAQAARLQDSRKNQQLSSTSAASYQSAAIEKSNEVPVYAAAPLAESPMSIGSLAGTAIPIAKQQEQQRAKRDEAAADYAKNISSPVLNIEGVAIGMSREQLVAEGLMCNIDVCHLDINQPQQENYWGIPAKNAHLTAFLSHQVVTKLVLQQKNAQLNQVKTALSNVGIVSQQSCIEEKGALLIGRQLGSNTYNVRSMGVGLSLAICQQNRSLNKP